MRLQKVDLNNASFAGITTDALLWHTCSGEKVTLSGSTLFKFRISHDSTFPALDLAGVTWKQGYCKKSNLSGADMQRAALERTIFDSCDLTRANLERTGLVRCRFLKCNLEAASLRMPICTWHRCAKHAWSTRTCGGPTVSPSISGVRSWDRPGCKMPT